MTDHEAFVDRVSEVVHERFPAASVSLTQPQPSFRAFIEDAPAAMPILRVSITLAAEMPISDGAMDDAPALAEPVAQALVSSMVETMRAAAAGTSGD